MWCLLVLRHLGDWWHVYTVKHCADVVVIEVRAPVLTSQNAKRQALEDNMDNTLWSYPLKCWVSRILCTESLWNSITKQYNGMDFLLVLCVLTMAPLVAQGLPFKEVAGCLNPSEDTFSNMFDKWGSQDQWLVPEKCHDNQSFGIPKNTPLKAMELCLEHFSGFLLVPC